MSLNGHLARGIVCARQAGIARSISLIGGVNDTSRNL